MSEQSPGMLKAAAIGGLALGVVAGLPLVGALNLCCCALIIGAGVLAAFIYSKDCGAVGAPFRAGKGAALGALTGVFYAIASFVVGTAAQLLMGGAGMEQIAEQLEGKEGIPPWVIEMLHNGAASGGLMIFAFLMVLVLGVIFATIGGAIGGAIFKVEPETPAPTSYPADSPPPPPAP